VQRCELRLSPKMVGATHQNLNSFISLPRSLYQHKQTHFKAEDDKQEENNCVLRLQASWHLTCPFVDAQPTGGGSAAQSKHTVVVALISAEAESGPWISGRIINLL
jgi:hypothetical protein